MSILYWFFELPTFLSFALIAGFFPAFGVLGLYISKKTFLKKLPYTQDRNDQVSFYMSVLGVFYGITLGLVAIGTWENFEAVQDKVATESATLAALYRDVSALPEPAKTDLQKILRKYTDTVIETEWPLQQKGIISQEGLEYLNRFQNILYAIEPKTPREEIILGEVIGKFNDLVMIRRHRVMTVGNSLPITVWMVTLVGALTCISFSWFLIMREFAIQVTLTALSAFFVGIMIFLIAMMDNPYTGAIAISSKSFEMVRDMLMR